MIGTDIPLNIKSKLGLRAMKEVNSLFPGKELVVNLIPSGPLTILNKEELYKIVYKRLYKAQLKYEKKRRTMDFNVRVGKNQCQ